MKTMKTAISMDADLFKQVDEFAKQQGVSRSEFFSRAVRHWVALEQNRDLLQRLNAAHDKAQSTEAEMKWLQSAKLRHANRLKGEW